LAVIDALRTLHPEAEFLWVGSEGGPERDLVSREDIPFEAVQGGPIVGVGTRALGSSARLAVGVGQASLVVMRFKPEAVLSTGGWPTIPATMASWGRAPIVIAMPDVEPGTTIQYLSRIAKRIAVPAEESVRFFKTGQAVVTGYPIRAGLLRAAGYGALGETPESGPPDQSAARRQAQEHFGLDPDLPTLLVFGGSKGARSINEALLDALPDLLPRCQILHLSGTLDADSVAERAGERRGGLPESQAARYHGYAYLHSDEMALALACADLVTSRSGASTLGEFPLFGLPAILVPYPHAWRYQKTNAEALAERGAAARLDDDHLAAGLLPLTRRLLDDPDERARMSQSARALARPDAAARIARLMIDLTRMAIT
jgi:UDP-N-acetylglucosamine--N-acetylmuramyl-(pentapeptide) pyrophosphoryl-undecaprenol N-acetylglucosamine transferase